MAPRAEFVSRGLNAPPPGDRSHNGEYCGTLEVRVLPPGVSGLDLAAARKGKPERGQVWRRGCVRVRVVAVALNTITVRELVPRGVTKRVPKALFMRTAVPEVL